jgi:Uma2 family endonuclease
MGQSIHPTLVLHLSLELNREVAMFPITQTPIKQTDPPRSPKETLPTMYDLPSEDPEEPGLPDEYHYLQPQLLSATLRLAHYPSDRIFSVGDMNLYYDVYHPSWYKRPDWFLAVGVPRLYDGWDTRMSYVVWQEGVSPFVVVELLSPGTEKEDLGEMQPVVDQPPPKWQVYEQILRVPYYIVFDRYTNELRAFGLDKATYQPLDLSSQRVWMPELEMSLGVWQGKYQGMDRLWLRWYDAEGNLIPTEAEAERQRADGLAIEAKAERQRADALAQRLRDLGIDV